MKGLSLRTLSSEPGLPEALLGKKCVARPSAACGAALSESRIWEGVSRHEFGLIGKFDPTPFAVEPILFCGGGPSLSRRLLAPFCFGPVMWRPVHVGQNARATQRAPEHRPGSFAPTKKGARRSERPQECLGSELYQFTLAYRASFAEVVTCFDAEAEWCPSGPAATCNSEDDSENSVSSPAKAHAANGTRDLTGTPPIVLVMAFPSEGPLRAELTWDRRNSSFRACPDTCAHVGDVRASA
jgi:hypothetical protein